MHIILYESSSHGGCYKYSIELYHAYRQHPEVESVTLLLPRNATFDGEGVNKVLIPDNKPGSKWHFIYRHFVNPIKLLWYVKKEERQKAEGRRQKTTSPDGGSSLKGGEWLVFSGWWFDRRTRNLQLATRNLEPKTTHSGTFLLLNDFEQMSAPLWSPLYRLFLRKPKIGVFLHDADRDAYPPTPRLSGYCMKQMMKAMDLALHHGTLPPRHYYRPNGRTRYLRVEHGLYHLPAPDKALKDTLKASTAPFRHIIGIIGHIRLEKNYSLLMKAIAQKPGFCLIVAGSPANSNTDVGALKAEAEQLGIAGRVVWIDRYLSEPEMTSVIDTCQTVALYYASSFHAQSGILNQVATLKKKVIVSDLPNALTDTVKKYGLGYICKADNFEALAKTIDDMELLPITPDWDRFFGEVDWSRQVETVIDELKE